MGKLTRPQLERHLLWARDILGGRMVASEECLFGMVLLKWCSDRFEARRAEIIAEHLGRGRTQAQAEQRAGTRLGYKGIFFVPPAARWDHLRDHVSHDVGDGLNRALAALVAENTALEGVQRHIDFARTVVGSTLPDKKLRALIHHLDKHRLLDEDFESPGLLGAACESLIAELADSAGEKGDELYTPQAVVRMMVALADPQAKMRVYDPCAGSGGILVQSARYVREHGGDPRNLGLFGQEDDGGVWSISKINLVLHGLPDADLRHGDPLGERLHVERGALTRFDRVLTCPPPSQADLPFVQHLVSLLRKGGMVCTVVPEGALFDGGAEHDIRGGLIEDDLLDAVIGLPANLFSGSDLPACALVLRAPGSRPKRRRGKVLLIDADAEPSTGRAAKDLTPDLVEKIVDAYQRYTDIPGFAAVMSRADLAKDDYRLHPRRSADNAPPPEPHDVPAHLLGGVPKAEVASHAHLFAAHGLDPSVLLVERDAHAFDFRPALEGKDDLKAQIVTADGVQLREGELESAFDAWWDSKQARLRALPKATALSALRDDLLASFGQALAHVGLLDRDQFEGAVATWWGEAIFDLKALMAGGFEGVVDGWVTTLTALAGGGGERPPLDHPLVKRLLPEYLSEIAAVEAEIADLEATHEAAIAQGDGGGHGGSDVEALSEAEISEMKRALLAAKRDLKTLHKDFSDLLEAAQAEVDRDEAEALVLDVLKTDLQRELNRRVVAHRQALVATVERWWDERSGLG